MYSKTCIMFCLVCWALKTRSYETDKYIGTQVWRTKLNSSKDIMTVSDLFRDLGISVWSLKPNRADFLVANKDKVKINRYLGSKGINHTVLIMDVRRRMNSLKPTTANWNQFNLRAGHRLNWNEFPTPVIIEEYLNFIAEYYSSICSVETIGYTAKNKSIKAVKISNGNPDNIKILISAGSHAREWTTITAALYVINILVTNYDQLPSHMVDKDWIIVPVLNPDGFKYTHSKDRLWRKNRRLITKCRGVDINRNFKTNWNISSITEKDECAESYCGPRPFSEAESTALRNLIAKLGKKTKVFIDLHSYGQMILYPWSALAKPTKDRLLHTKTAAGICKDIRKKTGRKYKFGATYDMIYPATGSSIDWAYSIGIKFSFAIEIDNEENGFLTPPKYIENGGMDVLTAANYLAVASEEIVARANDPQSWF